MCMYCTVSFYVHLDLVNHYTDFSMEFRNAKNPIMSLAQKRHNNYMSPSIESCIQRERGDNGMFITLVLKVL